MLRHLVTTLLVCLAVTVARVDAARASCSTGSFAMTFSALDILSGTSLDSTATIGVSCTSTLYTNGEVGIGCGTGTSCTGNLRQMVNQSNAAHKLRVEFYSNAGRTSVWQAGTLASTPGSYTGAVLSTSFTSGGTKTFTVYGRILGGQTTVPPGTYVWSGSTDPTIRYCDPFWGCLFTATDVPGSASTATVTIPAFCSVGASSTVAFPTQGLLTSAVDATGTVRVTCTNTTTYSIGLDTGSNASGSTRRMKHASAAAHVAYELYKDSGRSTVWGTSGGNLVTGTGTASEQSYTVYGRVPAQSPTPVPGAYSDTVTISVVY